MNTWHYINTAGLLTLIIGWSLVTFIATVIAALHFVMRAEFRGYSDGYRHAESYYLEK
jgi:hypothetical protein